MRDKADDTCPFAFDSIPDWDKAQEICDKVVFMEPFIVKYCLHRYRTQEMCDKAIDVSLPALKIVHDWFVTHEMLGNVYNVSLMMI